MRGPEAYLYQGDCLDVLQKINHVARLAYLDPPFNTGTTRKDVSGSYGDKFAEGEFTNWLVDRVEQLIPRMTPDGSIFVHLDYREVHYAKCALDKLLGRGSFMNEIVWVYDYGGRSKNRWSPKHDNILWYALDPKHYVFNFDEIERIPYMAPGLVGPERAALGKTLTDSWWHTIAPTNGPERVGYPTQKPLGILERIVKVHSEPGDVVIDPMCGSGTTGVAAIKNRRTPVLIDRNPQAIKAAGGRLALYTVPQVVMI